MGGGKAFYCPVIRSQFFIKTMSLDCKPHKCLLVFSSPLGEAE